GWLWAVGFTAWRGDWLCGPLDEEQAQPPRALHMREGIEMKRPIGITVLAILQVVSGAAFLLAAATLLIGNQSDASRQALAMAHLSASHDTIVSIGVFSLIVGALQLVVAVGLWQLKAWGWGIAALVSGANFVFGVVNVVNGARLPQ